MEITEVKVFPIDEEKLKAFVSVVFDHCFMVNDIKIIQGRDGLFISMPSRKKKNGEFKDVAHPLNNETRRMIEGCVLGEYERMLAERGEELPAPPRTPPVAAARRRPRRRPWKRRRRWRAAPPPAGSSRSRGAAGRRRRRRPPGALRRRRRRRAGGAGSEARTGAWRRSRSCTCATRSGPSPDPRRRARLDGASGARPGAGVAVDGASPSGKAPDFGSGYRRFESSRPSHAAARGQRSRRRRK